MPDWLPDHFWQAALVVFAGGFIRGFTGFGANMVMTPLYSLFIDPAQAVAAAWLQDTIAGAPLVPGAFRHTRWSSILWIAGASVVTFPLGLYVLVIADKDVMRRVIAGTLVVGAMLLLSGWRFRGEHTTPRDIACGAASGLIGGATSMGGIPFVFYYFAQNTAAAVTRASAYSLTAIIGVFGIVAFVDHRHPGPPPLVAGGLRHPGQLRRRLAGRADLQARTRRGLPPLRAGVPAGDRGERADLGMSERRAA